MSRFIPRRLSLLPRWQTPLAALAFVAVCALVAYAQAPPAGQSIGNQATATFEDGSGTTRTVTSNIVQTIVQQVASLTLSADGANTAAPGNQVTYPHTLTNTGNGTDTFTLTLVNNSGEDFDMNGIAIYADADQDGVPDNFTDLNGTGVPLAAGDAFHFVVVGTVPGTRTAAETSTMTVTAQSTVDTGQTVSNTDTTTVTGNAVINITKSIDVNTGAAGTGPYTYTLTYTNAGNDTALNVTLTDIIPTGMTYVPNSGRWSVTVAEILSDADAGDTHGSAPDTIVYDFNVTSAGTITAVINQVEAGESGTLVFQVTVDSGAVPGLINNTAQFTYDDGTGTIVGPLDTNTVPFTVTATRSVDLTDTGSTTDDDGDNNNDVVTENSASQGGTVDFANVVINTGNNTDTFNLTTSGSTFPAGTTFLLFQSDGATPLVDTNGDSIPDTGPMTPAVPLTVVVRAILPPGAAGAGPFDVTLTATSVNDAAVTDTVTDRLLTILANAVDLTNDVSVTGGAAAGDGLGGGPEPAAVRTNTTSAGSTTTFTLFVNNTGPAADTYDLAASTDSGFATLTLPAEWTVQFYLDDGSGTRDAGDTLITNTGSVPPGGDVLVFADVAVGEGFAAGTVDLFFRALSPTTAVFDVIHDAVTVATDRNITLVPDNVGQVFPGGVVVYPHTLTNEGNVTENSGLPNSEITISVANSQAGFTTVVYYDINNNGVVDIGTDPAIATNGTPGTLVDGGGTLVPLAPADSVPLLVRVVAPAGATTGTIDVATVTATTAGTINGVAAPAPVSATDTTTVISGDLSLEKTQAIDALCDGTADGAFDAANINANPGECVCYAVTATNTGSTDASNVVINDTTPAFTTLSTAPAITIGSISQQPTPGAAGPIQADVGTLTPLQAAVLSFCVQIDQ